MLTRGKLLGKFSLHWRVKPSIVLLAPLLLSACVGYATPEREVLWTPLGTYTREAAPAPAAP
jgi:hypothetical protein